MQECDETLHTRNYPLKHLSVHLLILPRKLATFKSKGIECYVIIKRSSLAKRMITVFYLV
jgi:hypothetical protein